MVRLARVTITSCTSPGSSPTSAWARTAASTASAETTPVAPRSGERKIGTFGDDAGVLDQIADAHDVAGDGGLRLQARPFGGGGRPTAAADSARLAKAATATMNLRVMVMPQRIRLEVADSIWSAAVITLAFIS